MQRDQLKPKKIYGYVAPRRTELQPVLFLSASLHTEKMHHRDDGTRDYLITPSHPAARVNRYNGYLGLLLTHPYYTQEKDLTPVSEQLQMLTEYVDKVPEILASLPTLTRTDGKFLVGPKLEVAIVQSRNFSGPWEDVFAARNAADAKSAAFNERGNAWADGRNDRLQRCRKGLEAVTGESVMMRESHFALSEPHSGQNGEYRSNGSITLTLEQVETIIAELAARPLAQ